MADAMAEIEELKKKLAQNPDSMIFMPLADAYRKAGMLDEAIEVCKAGLNKHSSYTSARVVLGRIYSEKEMVEEAIVELKKAEANDSDNLMVHSMLGNAYLKKKMYADAVSQFQKFLSLNPEDTEIQEKLQEALSAKQNPAAEKSRDTAKAVPEAPKMEEQKKEEKTEAPKIDRQKSIKAAELYTKKEEFDKAIELYRELLDEDAENIIMQQRLREVYDLQEKKAKRNAAKAQPQPSVKVDPDKFNTEDILDLMKQAVEDDSLESEEAKKPETKPEEKKAPEAKLPEVKPEEKKAEPAKPQEVKADASRGKQVEAILKKMGDEVEGIVGTFFLLRDGTILASVVPKSINEAETGRLITSIVNKTEESVKNMKQGKLNQVVIQAEKGQLLFTEIMTGVLFMIGDENINMGKMKLVLKNVVESIKKALS